MASLVASVTGFGGGVIMLPVLVWMFGVRDAIPVLTIVQVMSNLGRVWFNRTELSWTIVGWFSLGAVPAAIIGGVVFAIAPASSLVRLLGVFLLAVVIFQHSQWSKHLTIGLRGFLPLGGVTGFLAAVLGVVGPFMAPFFLAYGLVRGAYIGTEALAALTMHVTKLGVYGGYSLLNERTMIAGLAIGGIMFLGSYLGKRVVNRLPEKVFPYVIEVVLIFSGLLFLIRG